jgi:hypothetical protein
MPSQKDPWIENRRHVKGYGKGRNCRIPRSTLRQLRRVCAACGADDASALMVDHIDGVSTNNDLANLQVLCPACHTRKTSPGSRFAGLLAFRASRHHTRPMGPRVPDLTIREYLSCYFPEHLSVCWVFCHYACRLPSLECLRLKDITHERVLAVFSQILALGASRADCRKVARTMGTALKHAFRCGKLDALPCPLPLLRIRCLTSVQETELFRTLQEPQSNGRLWTAAAVVALMKQCYGVCVSLQTGRNYLCRSETPHRRRYKLTLETWLGEWMAKPGD